MHVVFTAALFFFVPYEGAKHMRGLHRSYTLLLQVQCIGIFATRSVVKDIDAGKSKGQGGQIVLKGHFDRKTIDHLNICGLIKSDFLFLVKKQFLKC